MACGAGSAAGSETGGAGAAPARAGIGRPDSFSLSISMRIFRLTRLRMLCCSCLLCPGLKSASSEPSNFLSLVLSMAWAKKSCTTLLSGSRIRRR